MDYETLVDLVSQEMEMIANVHDRSMYTHAFVKGDWFPTNNVLHQYSIDNMERMILSEFTKRLWDVHLTYKDGDMKEYPLLKGGREWQVFVGGGIGLALGTLALGMAGMNGLIEDLDSGWIYVPAVSFASGLITEIALKPIQRLFNIGRQKGAVKEYGQKVLDLQQGVIEELKLYHEHKEHYNAPMPTRVLQ